MLISTSSRWVSPTPRLLRGGNDSLVVWLVFEIELNSPTTQSYEILLTSLTDYWDSSRLGDNDCPRSPVVAPTAF